MFIAGRWWCATNLTPNPFPCGKGNNRVGFRERLFALAGLGRSLLLRDCKFASWTPRDFCAQEKKLWQAGFRVRLRLSLAELAGWVALRRFGLRKKALRLCLLI